jgi:hypothetical protein
MLNGRGLVPDEEAVEDYVATGGVLWRCPGFESPNSRSSSKLTLIAYLGLAPAGRTRGLIISRRAPSLSLSSYLLS